MSGPSFFQTHMGQRFYEGTMPGLVRELKRLNDNFERLVAAVVDYDDLDETHAATSARQRVGEFLTDPLLVEMLFCPLMFYGSAREHDMDWGQFSIMFRSIFMEGLGRPHAGVRLILKQLVRKFRGLGGELKLRAGVARMEVDGDRVARVVLDSGEITSLVITGDGVRVCYFYSADPSMAIRVWQQELQPNVHSHQVTFRVRPDAEWQMYRSFLDEPGTAEDGDRDPGA